MYECRSGEDQFNDASASEPYLPKDIRVKAKLKPSDKLKDNEEAKSLVLAFDTDQKECLNTPSKHCHNMVDLERKQAENLHLTVFS